jgi:hypothetical protein
MKNHFVKKWETLFYSKQQNCQNKKTNCLNIFKSYIIICDIMFFADKNKANSIPLS